MRPLSLTFLGTCSGGGPTASRNCTSTALNFARTSWLIDCAEGTQHQFLKFKRPSAREIDRIFITHMHVDHVFGLIPLMSTMMFALTYKGDPNAIRLQLYGPSGLRSFVRSNLKATSMQLAGKYQVHELLSIGTTPTSSLPEELHENESPGQDILAAPDGTWPDFAQAPEATVSAGPLQHRVPSLGYVFQEPEQFVLSRQWLDYLDNIPLDLLPSGMLNARHFIPRIINYEDVTLTDGTPVRLPPTTLAGRKVVILGDTCDSSGIAELAQDADLLVHEATNAPVVRPNKGYAKTEWEVAATARSRGHSTPRMAGEFAKRVRARSLVLNHFSSMFPGPPPRGNRAPWARQCESVLEQIRKQAVETFGCAKVVPAHDGLEIDVPFYEEPPMITAIVATEVAITQVSG